jgi:hypothetical protein
VDTIPVSNREGANLFPPNLLRMYTRKSRNPFNLFPKTKFPNGILFDTLSIQRGKRKKEKRVREQIMTRKTITRWGIEK